MRQCEHIERSAGCRVLREVRHRVHEAERRGAIARIDGPRHYRSGPSADTGEHGDVLMSVGTAIGHRLTDDSAVHLEPPKQRAAPRRYSLEPAVHRAVEDDVTPRDDRPRPHGEIFLDLP